MWLGRSCVRWFARPDGTLVEGARSKWFTNLEHAGLHEPLTLTEKYYDSRYPTYDNYDAINVDKVVDIPMDYDGVMGVPITYLDKYCPEQFEIVGATESEGKGFSAGLWTGGVAQATVAGHKVYKRLFIKRRPSCG